VTAQEEFISKDNYSQPNFGFGIHYMSDKFYFGLSIPEFRYNTINELGEKISTTLSDKLRVYAYGGYHLKVGENSTLTPLAYLYYSAEDDLQLDLGAKLRFKSSFEIGARYRTREAFGVTARVRLLDELWLGYAYEGNSSDIDNRFNSVQEISMTFRLGKKTKDETKKTAPESYEDINSIRYF
jgi:type IX secretion system PorP/SprF family membrane protein